MKKVTKKELRKTALKLLPAIYDSAMRTGAEDGLFQHEDWRTGLCLDAFLLAEAFEKAANYRDAEPEPQLKQLDQSAFDHPYVDDRFKYVALNADSQAVFFESKPVISNCLDIWVVHTGSIMPMLKGYDTSNWQNSLIEREKKGLTGSDLALELLKNQRYIIASVSDVSDADAIECGNNKLIHKSSEDIFTDDMGGIYCWAVALNNQGEPLTASEVGL